MIKNVKILKSVLPYLLKGQTYKVESSNEEEITVSVTVGNSVRIPNYLKGKIFSVVSESKNTRAKTFPIHLTESDIDEISNALDIALSDYPEEEFPERHKALIKLGEKIDRQIIKTKIRRGDV